MEENKEKTTEELLKENNELLKTLIGKLGIIRVSAWIFVIGIVISALVYLLAAISSCNGYRNSYSGYSQHEDSILGDYAADSVFVDDTTGFDTF